MITVLKNLTPKVSEKKKVWFIEIEKVFQEKNLKIFYLPMPALYRLIVNRQFIKLPDPISYFVGITYFPKENSVVDLNKKKEVQLKSRENSISNTKISLM